MHTFKNFKNFVDVEIDLSKPMTLLIGRNGSGKSNLIEGVELLAELIKGREVHEISDIERGGEFEVRGSLNGCFKKGSDTFELGFIEKTIFNNENKEVINLYYEVLMNSKPTIEYESFDNFESISHKILEKERKEHFGTDEPSEEDLLYDSFDHETDEWMKENPNLYQNLFLQKYKNVYAYDIYPRIMRQYSPIGLKQLSKNGENISSVIYYLKQNYPDVLEKILEQIKQFPEESFIGFEFITTSDDSDVLFALKYPNGEIINAKLLSDGTLRALAILTALETIPEDSRIIIEEIDNGVHASRTKILLDAIWETSHRRNLKTLITTHNSATLDGLDEKQLSSVVVCHYDKESESAKLTPFFELPNAIELHERGGLGSIVTKNYIEQHLDPNFEEERKKIALEWLESME